MTCPRPGDDACTDHTPCQQCPVNGQGWLVQASQGLSEGLNPVPRHPWTPHPQTGAHRTDERCDQTGQPSLLERLKAQGFPIEYDSLRERLITQGFPDDLVEVICTETDQWLTDHNTGLSVHDIDET